MECWKFCSDAKGRPQFKIYVEDISILNTILKLSGVKQSATYSNGHFKVIGWDVIIPANRMKAVRKLAGIKSQKIRFI